MINKLSLTNFKSFKELKDLNIKPITILCGSNSCGKSTIIQSLLLIKQTLESQNPHQSLLLNGRFNHLGSFENCIYQRKPGNIVTLEFSTTLDKQEKNKLKTYFLRELMNKNGDSKYHIDFKISFKAIDQSSQYSHLQPYIVDELSFEAWATKDKILFSIEIKNTGKDLYRVKWYNLPLYFDSPISLRGENVFKLGFIRIFPTSLRVQQDSINNEYRAATFTFQVLSDLLEYIFSTISYLGPLREEPSRRYIYDNEVIEIGIKGENAPFIFLMEKDNLVYNHFFYNDRTEKFTRRPRIKLYDAVDKWLNLMNMKNVTPEYSNEIISLMLNSSVSEETRVNIADVGFGVSQIFPIILEGLRMRSGNTLILEQPEIHLHPNIQMLMADYFIALALSNKKLIVETHSDHVVNRLVRRIVEDESEKLNDLIGIYFIKSTSEGSVFEEIRIDDTRGIVNWPKDFFDQTPSEQERIIKAGLRKRLQKKG